MAHYDLEKDKVVSARCGSWSYWHERGHQFIARNHPEWREFEPAVLDPLLKGCLIGFFAWFGMSLIQIGSWAAGYLFAFVGFIAMAYYLIDELAPWVYALCNKGKKR